jgi:hypothetical protein
MTKSELIEKWQKEKEMYKRICNDSLMYTREERIKAASKLLILVSILADVDGLNSL